MAEVVTVEELADFIGVDGTDESIRRTLERLRASAIESINRACGFDWTGREDLEQFNEAVRVQVWLSYYAVRDPAQNTAFLERYLTGLICSLQLSPAREEAAPDDL